MTNLNHDQHHQHGKAVLFMVIAMLLLPGLDAFAKLLSKELSAGQIVFYRFLFQAGFLLPVVMYRKELLASLRISPVIQFMRGALVALATLFFFSALKYMPLAESISIFFVEPMILTILSALLLGETIRYRRIIAIFVGFIGAIIIIRPSFEIFGWSALWPLCAAVCFAFYVVLTRQISGRVGTYPMQFSAGLMAFIVMAVALYSGHVFDIDVLTPALPSINSIWMVFGLGVFATVGHIFLVSAVRYADTSLLAPFQYLEIISATILGYLIFSDLPDRQTLVGVTIIIGSGVYLMHRERLSRLRDKQQASHRS
jgi:S-adenosylmethionine uptake transporter